VARQIGTHHPEQNCELCGRRRKADDLRRSFAPDATPSAVLAPNHRDRSGSIAVLGSTMTRPSSSFLPMKLAAGKCVALESRCAVCPETGMLNLILRKGAEEARNQLPDLLEAAWKGASLRLKPADAVQAASGLAINAAALVRMTAISYACVLGV
jgi:hypothetical protein